MLERLHNADWKNGYIYLYVQKIINMKKQHGIENEDETDFVDKTKKKISEKTYKKNPDFYFSTRIMMATVLSTSVIYILTLYFVIFGYIELRNVNKYVENPVIEALRVYTKLTLQDIKDYVYCLAISWWIAVCFAVVFYIFSMMNSFKWYRRHVVMLRKGDRSFLPNSIKKGSLDPPTLMVSSLKFAGFQVAYSIWGFLVTFTILFIFSVLIIVQLILPIKRRKLSYGLQIFLQIWPSLLIGLIITLAQKIVAMYCFLIDKQTLAVNNRRFFHITSYFMFYFNIFLGMGSCLLRIIFGFIYGVIFMQRLQKSTLPRSYERRDPGYVAYIGFLLIEHQHANPVLQCFVQLLLEHHKENKKQKKYLKDMDKLMLELGRNNKSFVEHDQRIMKSTRKFKNTKKQDTENKRIETLSKRMKTRWHLYKMLILNPSLRIYRKNSQKVFSKGLSNALLNISGIELSSTNLNNERYVKVPTSIINKTDRKKLNRSVSFEIDAIKDFESDTDYLEFDTEHEEKHTITHAYIHKPINEHVNKNIDTVSNGNLPSCDFSDNDNTKRCNTKKHGEGDVENHWEEETKL